MLGFLAEIQNPSIAFRAVMSISWWTSWNTRIYSTHSRPYASSMVCHVGHTRFCTKVLPTIRLVGTRSSRRAQQRSRIFTTEASTPQVTLGYKLARETPR
ncbi:hypothetical protein Y032_0453g1718 [Ancylostoma ceylanicum]|nr:hypothetical protein Y032_0453g1718 [Ancylostoma ceylanicum]